MHSLHPAPPQKKPLTPASTLIPIHSPNRLLKKPPHRLLKTPHRRLRANPSPSLANPPLVFVLSCRLPASFSRRAHAWISCCWQCCARTSATMSARANSPWSLPHPRRYIPFPSPRKPWRKRSVPSPVSPSERSTTSAGGITNRTASVRQPCSAIRAFWRFWPTAWAASPAENGSARRSSWRR